MITTILELAVGTVWTIAMLVTMWMVGFLFTSRLYQTRELREYWSPAPRWESIESMIAMWPVFLIKIPERITEYRERQAELGQREAELRHRHDEPDEDPQIPRFRREPPGLVEMANEADDDADNADPHPRRNVP